MQVDIVFYPREARRYHEVIPFEINGLSTMNVEIFGEGTDMKVICFTRYSAQHCLCKEYSVLPEIGLLQIWSVKNLLTASGIRQNQLIHQFICYFFYVDQGICFLPFVYQARRQALTTG